MWAKIADGLPEDPKVLKLGADMAAAFTLYVGGECYCARHLSDGAIPLAAVSRLTYLEDSQRLAGRLVEVGLWRPHPDGFESVDYLLRNPSAEAYRAWVEGGRRGGIRSAEKRRQKAESNPPLEPGLKPPLEPGLNEGCDPIVPSRQSSSGDVFESVSDSAAASECIAALMQRFPKANRSDLNNTIMDEFLREDGAAVVREAVRRTISRATSANPTKYLRDCLVSVRRGE